MDGDLGWLGLVRHEGGWSMEVTPPLGRFDGKLRPVETLLGYASQTASELVRGPSAPGA